MSLSRGGKMLQRNGSSALTLVANNNSPQLPGSIAPKRQHYVRAGKGCAGRRAERLANQIGSYDYQWWSDFSGNDEVGKGQIILLRLKNFF